MWTLDPVNRKVRPIQVTTSKEIRTYTCIAMSDDDQTLYCGTTTGDVMVVSAEKQTLLKQGPPKKLGWMTYSSISPAIEPKKIPSGLPN